MKDYLIHSIHDDNRAVLADKGLRRSRLQSFVSTAGMVSVVNGAIAGVFIGVATRIVIGLPINLAMPLGILVSLLSMWMLGRYHLRAWADAERALPILFPEQGNDHEPS
jgi:hypothetical protein